MIIDGQTVYIMTCNFTLAALGTGKYTLNREYGIIDNNAQDVQAVSAIFNADWKRRNAQYNDPNLVVSPDNSRNAFASLINGAHKTLAIEAEEMQDSQIEQDLVNAAQRGVQVQVILPASSSSDEKLVAIAIVRVSQPSNKGACKLKRITISICMPRSSLLMVSKPSSAQRISLQPH